jgi:predicted ATPase
MSDFERTFTTVGLPLHNIPKTFAAGRYRVTRPLGEGGQKNVLLARDMRLDRDVVISLLKPGAEAAMNRERLVREARALGRLGDHPNIVTVFDIGDEQGCPYLVSQYVQGGPLADLLNASAGGLLPLAQAMKIALEVCRALSYAHQFGIVHRDVKPSNIWLTQEGTVKLGDFGLALRLDSSQVSMQGMLVGTVAYISPEQAEGQPAAPASDLYALGVVLYEMLTGRCPFLSDNLVGVVWQHVNTAPVAPSWHNPEIPAQVEELVLHLLAKQPAERPASAAKVAETLAAIAGSQPAMQQRVVTPARSILRMASGIFVGRDAELNQLRAAAHEALECKGGVVMIVGEPGSGKTHTAEQLTTYARLHGFQVLAGRCYEGEGAPPFWPWVQMIRSYAQNCESAALSTNMSSGASAIAEIVPELRGRLGGLETLPPLEPAQARFRLFESVTTFLKNASQAKPLLLILDDLHWADAPSLLLLVFLARELGSARILLAGTYRDIVMSRHHPLSQTLGDLARQGLAHKIPLGGLTEDDVARFIEISTGIAPSQKLLRLVYAQTEGNPFFVSETVKLLLSEGRLRGESDASFSGGLMPEGVREVIRRRLNQLSDDCNKALSAASVLGRDFSTNVLQRVCDLPGDRLLEALDEAAAARVITQSSQTAGRCSFSHALILEVLYGELGANLRVRLHSRAGAAMEEAFGFQLDEYAAELARHYLQAAPGGDVKKAIAYAVRAAQQATSRLAYEESVGHYERALEALETHTPSDEKRRCELLLALADAVKKTSSGADSRVIFERAAECARRTEQPESLARAVLGISATWAGALGTVDEVHVRLLNEALEKLPSHDSAIRAKVLAQLSAVLYHSPDRRVPLSLEAVEMARRVGDPVALITALYCRHIALVLTDDLEQRRQVALEILRIAEATGAKELMLRAWYRLAVDAMEMADMAGVDAAIEKYALIAEEIRQPSYLWMVPFLRGNRALLQGRFADCERLAQEAITISSRVEDPAAMLFLATQMTVLRVERGHAEEQVTAVEGYLQKYPMIPGYRATLAYLYCHLDRPQDARREMERVMANHLAGLPRDGSWIVVLSSLSWVCWCLKDAAAAAEIYPLLLPYARRNIVTGNAGVGCGSVWRPLGLLSGTMSRWDDAIRELEQAVEMNGRMGARVFEAGAKHEFAQALLARGDAAGRKRAKRLLRESLAVSVALGASALEKRIRLTQAALT